MLALETLSEINPAWLWILLIQFSLLALKMFCFSVLFELSRALIRLQLVQERAFLNIASLRRSY